MKKHIIGILILLLVLSLLGVGIWFAVRKNNTKNLYEANTEFIEDDNTANLLESISQAEALYQAKVFSAENRLTILHATISKIDCFEQDLSSYLILSNKTNKTTNKLSKNYKSLSNSRKSLIGDYNEYITRMKGNIAVDGTALTDLYNDIFSKTCDYVYKYNNCFNATFKYAFDKIYKVDTIKSELYTLYSASVNNLLNNISNSQFKSVNLINRLNGGLHLEDSNILIKDSIAGGEFGLQSRSFKKYFNSCNLTALIENFETYYATASSINPTTETSYEKLTVYYAKQILEI